MKHTFDEMKKSWLVLLPWMLLTLSVGCESDGQEDESLPVEGQLFEYQLRMNADCQDFDSPVTRAASSWANGSVVQLRFLGSGSIVEGTATYQSSNGIWKLQTNRTLPTTSSAVCEGRYTEPASTTGQSMFYRATFAGEGSYSCSNGEVVVDRLVLTPATWRLRFQGVNGTKVTVMNTDLVDVDGNQLTQSMDMTINGGYTPYIYATFVNEQAENVIRAKTDQVYSRTLAKGAMQKANSYVLTTPLKSNYASLKWSAAPQDEGDIITVTVPGTAVSFKMIKVQHGTFKMGDESPDATSEEGSVHTVTLTKDYYIGETEVTQELWKAVTGKTPTDAKKWDNIFGLSNKRPAYYVTWNDCQDFIKKLNLLTGRMFRLPTEAEWEFAARGGLKSRGYIYSGSSTIEDVSWFNANKKTYEVAGKKANELGLYDMSGNVNEWVQDWYKSRYSSAAQTDPTGPETGNYRVYRGGGCDFYNAHSFRVTARGHLDPSLSSYGVGLRLAQ